MSRLLFNPQALDNLVFDKLKLFETKLKQSANNINLVSRKDLRYVWERHILDSLQLMPFLGNGQKIADVGAGVGLPSIPLAVCLNSACFWAVDRSLKKSILCRQFIQTLNLTNVKVVPDGVESLYDSPTFFDVVICRALGSFVHDSQLISPILKTGGFFITFKTLFEHSSVNNFMITQQVSYQLPHQKHGFSLIIAQKLHD